MLPYHKRRDTLLKCLSRKTILNNHAQADATEMKEERQISVSVMKFAKHSVTAAWTSTRGKYNCFSSIRNISSRCSLLH